MAYYANEYYETRQTSPKRSGGRRDDRLIGNEEFSVFLDNSAPASSSSSQQPQHRLSMGLGGGYGAASRSHVQPSAVDFGVYKAPAAASASSSITAAPSSSSFAASHAYSYTAAPLAPLAQPPASPLRAAHVAPPSEHFASGYGVGPSLHNTTQHPPQPPYQLGHGAPQQSYYSSGGAVGGGNVSYQYAGAVASPARRGAATDLGSASLSAAGAVVPAAGYWGGNASTATVAADGHFNNNAVGSVAPSSAMSSGVNVVHHHYYGGSAADDTLSGGGFGGGVAVVHNHNYNGGGGGGSFAGQDASQYQQRQQFQQQNQTQLLLEGPPPAAINDSAGFVGPPRSPLPNHLYLQQLHQPTYARAYGTAAEAPSLGHGGGGGSSFTGGKVSYHAVPNSRPILGDGGTSAHYTSAAHQSHHSYQPSNSHGASFASMSAVPPPPQLSVPHPATAVSVGGGSGGHVASFAHSASAYGSAGGGYGSSNNGYGHSGSFHHQNQNPHHSISNPNASASATMLNQSVPSSPLMETTSPYDAYYGGEARDSALPAHIVHSRLAIRDQFNHSVELMSRELRGAHARSLLLILQEDEAKVRALIAAAENREVAAVADFSNALSDALLAFKVSEQQRREAAARQRADTARRMRLIEEEEEESVRRSSAAEARLREHYARVMRGERHRDHVAKAINDDREGIREEIRSGSRGRSRSASRGGRPASAGRIGGEHHYDRLNFDDLSPPNVGGGDAASLHHHSHGHIHRHEESAARRRLDLGALERRPSAADGGLDIVPADAARSVSPTRRRMVASPPRGRPAPNNLGGGGDSLQQQQQQYAVRGARSLQRMRGSLNSSVASVSADEEMAPSFPNHHHTTNAYASGQQSSMRPRPPPLSASLRSGGEGTPSRSILRRGSTVDGGYSLASPRPRAGSAYFSPEEEADDYARRARSEAIAEEEASGRYGSAKRAQSARRASASESASPSRRSSSTGSTARPPAASPIAPASSSAASSSVGPHSPYYRRPRTAAELAEDAKNAQYSNKGGAAAHRRADVPPEEAGLDVLEYRPSSALRRRESVNRRPHVSVAGSPSSSAISSARSVRFVD